MEQARNVLPYLSVLVERPPEEVAGALRRAMSAASGVVTTRAGAKLVLTAAVLPLPPQPVRWWPVCVASGRLHVAICAVPIELEVLPWTSATTELGLRPAGSRAWLPGRRRFREAGSQVLDDLAAALGAGMAPTWPLEMSCERSSSDTDRAHIGPPVRQG